MSHRANKRKTQLSCRTECIAMQEMQRAVKKRHDEHLCMLRSNGSGRRRGTCSTDESKHGGLNKTEAQRHGEKINESRKEKSKTHFRRRLSERMQATLSQRQFPHGAPSTTSHRTLRALQLTQARAARRFVILVAGSPLSASLPVPADVDSLRFFWGGEDGAVALVVVVVLGDSEEVVAAAMEGESCRSTEEGLDAGEASQSLSLPLIVGCAVCVVGMFVCCRKGQGNNPPGYRSSRFRSSSMFPQPLCRYPSNPQLLSFAWKAK